MFPEPCLFVNLGGEVSRLIMNGFAVAQVFDSV